MNFDQLCEMLREIMTDIRHGSCYPGSLHFILYRCPRSPDACGICLYVHPAVQRVNPALKRREFPLRIAGQQHHVGGLVVEIAYPARHAWQLSLCCRCGSVMAGDDLPAISNRANDQGMSRVKPLAQTGRYRFDDVLPRRFWCPYCPAVMTVILFDARFATARTGRLSQSGVIIRATFRRDRGCPGPTWRSRQAAERTVERAAGISAGGFLANF